jgi:hypothetical protein
MTTWFREGHTHLLLRMTMWMKGNVACEFSHEGEWKGPQQLLSRRSASISYVPAVPNTTERMGIQQ